VRNKHISVDGLLLRKLTEVLFDWFTKCFVGVRRRYAFTLLHNGYVFQAV